MSIRLVELVRPSLHLKDESIYLYIKKESERKYAHFLFIFSFSLLCLRLVLHIQCAGYRK